MTYEITHLETEARIECPSGGFDVTDLDGRKINVTVVRATSDKTGLVQVELEGNAYKADGKAGSRTARASVWPLTSPMGEDDVNQFLPWHILPVNLASTITSILPRGGA